MRSLPPGEGSLPQRYPLTPPSGGTLARRHPHPRPVHEPMATSSPPSGCPMHSALPTPAPSASPPSGCPMHKARPAKVDEVNPVRASTARIASLPAALPARAAQPTRNAQAAPCGLLPGQRDADRAEPAARHGAACTAVHAPGQLKHPRALGRSYPSPNPNRNPYRSPNHNRDRDRNRTATATATLTPIRTRTRTRTLTLTLALPLTKATGSTRRSRCSSTLCAGRATVS